METMKNNERPRMSVEDACALLNAQNPYSEDVVAVLMVLQRMRNLTIRRKNDDLVEVVQELNNRKLYPLVDKNLKLVLGISASHEQLRLRLFRYHHQEKNPNDLAIPPINDNEAMDRYITDGYGYLISSMRPNTIVMGADYRPDSFDKDLLMMYNLDRV
ncbi:MAG: hypothetical protein NUV88_03175 [Candidatus Kaiserbacteria bacterium]|nr:hypothetical protein [Candidatus Kaiserbacteria bacterium]